MEDEKKVIEEENLSVEKEEVKKNQKIKEKIENHIPVSMEEFLNNCPVYISIEEFLNKYPNLNDAEKYHYINNNKTDDLRTESDWKGITQLN